MLPRHLCFRSPNLAVANDWLCAWEDFRVIGYCLSFMECYNVERKQESCTLIEMKQCSFIDIRHQNITFVCGIVYTCIEQSGAGVLWEFV